MAFATRLLPTLRLIGCAVLVPVVAIALGCSGPPDVPEGVLENSMPEGESGLLSLLEREPSNIDAWAALWWMLQTEGEAEQLNVARECVERNPRSADAHALLGAHYDGFGRWVDAEIAFRDAIRLDPASQASLSLCGLLRRLHLTAESIQVASAALRAVSSGGAAQPALKPSMERGAPTVFRRLEPVEMMEALAMELWLAGAESEAAKWAETLPVDSFYRWAFSTLEAQRSSKWAGPITVPGWLLRGPEERETRKLQDQRVEAYWLLALLAITYQQGGVSESWPPAVELLEQGLQEHDDPRIREACLFGSLAAAWIRSSNDRSAMVGRRIGTLEGRLRSLAGPRTLPLLELARFMRPDASTGGSPMTWTGVLPAASHAELALRVQAIPNGALFATGIGHSVRNSYGIQWRNHPFVDALSVAVLRDVRSPELAVSVAQSRYGLKDWAGVRAAAALALEWLKEDQGASAFPATSGPEAARSLPSRNELLMAVAKELGDEARYYAGDRDAVVRELRASDNDVRSRPWLLVVDEYWKERERRGLPPPIPTLLPDGMKNG